MYSRGINGMREGISNTAEYGDYTRGPRVVGESARTTMRQILKEIQEGTFAREWVQEHAAGKPRFASEREQAKAHQIESVGKELRGLMPWLRSDESASSGTDTSGNNEEELKFRVC
jgi:ketol-acid reductoisomerase